jgi:hypothetical protein
MEEIVSKKRESKPSFSTLSSLMKLRLSDARSSIPEERKEGALYLTYRLHGIPTVTNGLKALLLSWLTGVVRETSLIRYSIPH